MLEIKPHLPPVFTDLSHPILGGHIQEDLLSLKSVQMTDEEGRTIFLEVPRKRDAWEKTYYPLGRRLWRKLERFSEMKFNARQLDLWDEDEEDEILSVLVDITPLARSTDQAHMIWIIRLELRKRIKRHYYTP